MRRLFLCLSLLVLLSARGAAAPERPEASTVKPADRVLNVYWTDQPPVMDGLMDDPCWQDAEVAGDFILLRGEGWPREQCEVRVTYDAENLYLFWKVYESRMEELRLGVGEPPGTDTRIPIDYTVTDLVELFLDPGASRATYFHFMISARGTRYDALRRPTAYQVAEYQPNWQAAAGRWEGGWTLETRFPFTELSYYKALVGTPAVGETWAVNFCRNRIADWREWTQWSPTQSGFHDPANFGTLLFHGRRAGAQVPSVTAADPGVLDFGPGAMEFQLAAAPPDLQVHCTLHRLGSPKQDCPAEVQGERVRIPYRLLDPGEYRLRLSMESGGETFYTAQANTALSAQGREALTAMEQGLRDGRRLLARRAGDHPRFARLQRELEDFSARSASARDQLARGDTLTAAEWRALDSQAQGLQARWQQLEFDLSLVRLYPGQAGRGLVPFALGWAHADEKIYHQTLYRGSLTDPVRLSLAGNEYGSYQLLLLPFWTNLRDVEVSFSDFRGPGGRRLPAQQCRWFRVDYIKATGVNPDDPDSYRYEPDPLLPPESFTAPAGQVTSLWVDVLLPEGTPAGVYRGEVTVSAGGHQVSRPVEVRSYGFDIPQKSSLETDWWFHIGYNWRQFYGPADFDGKYTTEIHARNARLLGSYRISSFISDWSFLCQYVPLYREPDGRFTFDWTVFDQHIEIAQENHSTAYWIALSCNSGWTAWLNTPSRQILDRATGEKRPLSDFYQPEDWNWRRNADTYRNNPLYRDFLLAYVEHLRELGILEVSYYELFDEAHDPLDWQAMLEHHEFFRELVPELRLCNFGYSPTDRIAGRTAHGLIDAWAPHLTEFEKNDSEIWRLMLERRERYGEKIWAYSCGETSDGQGNYSPYILYTRPYLALRLHGWFAWKYQLDGYLLFMLTGMDPENLLKPAAERWPHSDWVWKDGPWCGTQVYPGPDLQLITGMRLANAREGLEDLEYFVVLRREAAQLDPARHAELLQRVEAALEIEPDIIESIYLWTKDRRLLEAKRDQLAALIRAVQRAQRS